MRDRERHRKTGSDTEAEKDTEKQGETQKEVRDRGRHREKGKDRKQGETQKEKRDRERETGRDTETGRDMERQGGTRKSVLQWGFLMIITPSRVSKHYSWRSRIWWPLRRTFSIPTNCQLDDNLLEKTANTGSPGAFVAISLLLWKHGNGLSGSTSGCVLPCSVSPVVSSHTVVKGWYI